MTLSSFRSPKILFSLLLVVLVFGAFLRFYQVGPWLHFELDQARDALVIDEAINNGPAELPLLGPKAGGTFLRLGPAYYYMGYISALIFGGGVVAQMLFIPLLGTALIGVFYLFLRRVYSKAWSLLGTSWIAVSAYAVLYSRFGWNPNTQPFFILTGFLCLLYAVDTQIERKKRNWALLGASFLLTLGTQMHFLAFLALPIITVIFLLIVRPRFSGRVWAMALLMPIILYLPMYLNETKTSYANTQEFFGAITEKSTKEEKSTLEKLIKNTAEYGMANMIMLTGTEKATFPKIDMNGIRIASSECVGVCDEGKWLGLGGIMLFGIGFVLFLFRFWQAPRRSPEAHFFLLVTLWQLVSFLLFLPLAYGIAPRFYLLTLPLFFISALGILSELRRLPRNVMLIAVIIFGGGIIALNLIHLENRFSELRRAAVENVVSAPDRILKEEIRVTKEQQEKVIDYIVALPEVREKPLYFESVPQYKRALKYGLSQRGLPTDGISKAEIYRQGTFVYVIRSRTNARESYQELLEKYNLLSEEPVGTLTILLLSPKEEAITKERQVIEPQGMVEGSLAPKRYTWREWWQDEGGQIDEEEENEEESNE